jgi:5-(aminomethyl)-3-furanmethanol phosphate kinase
MWVIKIGGSLLGANELASWLRIVSLYGDGKVIIVPGGGVFADAVRSAQHITELSEKCAHELAVKSMDQFASILVDIEPSLAKARNELELAERGWQHRGIVWLPSEMVLADSDIPQTWDVTSDSIAAWLADRVNADRLILLKSGNPIAESNLQDLVDQGYVDKAFPSFIENKNFESWIVENSQYIAFANGFSTTALADVGIQIK